MKSGKPYMAVCAEGIANVGDVTPLHHHPGPEAWYTMAGETCVETPAGKMVGRAGSANIIPADTPVTILAPGTERSIWLVLHESAHPWTAPVSHWTPKGLCKKQGRRSVHRVCITLQWIGRASRAAHCCVRQRWWSRGY